MASSAQTHNTKVSPLLTLPRVQGPRGQMAQRPKTEPNMIGEKRKGKCINVRFMVIFGYAHRLIPSTIVFREPLFNN